MKKYFIVFMILFLLVSCDNKIEKKVYFDFQIGKSFDYNRNRVNQLCESGLFLQNIDRYPYTEHKLKDGKYYSAPFFLTFPGDTIVAEIQVIYLTDLYNLKSDMEGLHNDNRVMNLPLYSEGGITPDLIKEDIIKNLNEKYGNFDSLDTLRPINIDGYKLLYNWKDREDVNIELNYLFDASFMERTSILLKYNFTDEIKEKLKKKSSVY